MMIRALLLTVGLFGAVSLRAGLFDTNLIVNGDAESGQGSITDADVYPVPGWVTTNNFTVVVYGVPSSFPTNAAGPLNRGTNFFAGGPGNPLSSATQLVDISS